MNLSAKSVALVAIVGVATLALAVQASWPKVVTNKTLYAENDFRGKKAPSFFVEKWLNVKEVDTRGKVVVIDFWATWCSSCREFVPELNGLAKKFNDKVVVIGLSDEPAATVIPFMKANGMTYNIGIDTTKQHMFKALGVKGRPHVIVISPDGIVRWQGFPHDDDDPLTDKVIQQILDASFAK